MSSKRVAWATKSASSQLWSRRAHLCMPTVEAPSAREIHGQRVVHWLSSSNRGPVSLPPHWSTFADDSLAMRGQLDSQVVVTARTPASVAKVTRLRLDLINLMRHTPSASLNQLYATKPLWQRRSKYWQRLDSILSIQGRHWRDQVQSRNTEQIQNENLRLLLKKKSNEGGTLAGVKREMYNLDSQCSCL